MRFGDVEEGEELPVRELFLAKERVRDYARAANQWAPRFTDDDGARREGLPGMITPGNMSMGLLTAMIEAWADRNVRLCGTVTQKDEQARTVELDVWLESDDGERLVIGTATVALD
jgi:acyl dehydratase